MGNGTSIDTFKMKHLSSVIKQLNQFIKTSTHSHIYLTVAKRFKSHNLNQIDTITN
jgi:hypothetical protein